MPRYTKRGKREFRLGEFWVGEKSDRPGYCRCWYDRRARQTRYESLGTDDWDTACDLLTDWFVRHHREKDQKPERALLAQVLMAYHEDYAKSAKGKIRSGVQAEIAIRYWIDFFKEHFTVAELTIEQQEDFIDHLRKRGLSDGYIHRIMGVGRAAINRALERSHITAAPKIIGCPGWNKRKFRLTIDQMAALFDAATLPHARTFLMLAVGTLSRPEAILELTIFQFDREHRLLDLNPAGRKQTKKFRPVVPVVDALLPWLVPGQPAKKGPNKGKPVTHIVTFRGKPIDSLKTMWATMRETAGLPEQAVPYTIRHTMASYLRKQGVPSWEVSGILGHLGASSTTEGYAEFDPDYLGHAARAIQAYFEALAPRVKTWDILRSDCVPEARKRHLRIATDRGVKL